MIGPAIGGVLFAVSPEARLRHGRRADARRVRSCSGSGRARVEQGPIEIAGTRLGSLLAGLRFVRTHARALGRDLARPRRRPFGGAVALLPLFARDVLEVGPVGLGVLRSAPAVGAMTAGVMLTRRPLRGTAGRKLLVVVGVFGASMVVFGLSHSFPLSFARSLVSGFADMISMNIRSMIAALATPDMLRGRVNAVEMVFISASNELGAFESGRRGSAARSRARGGDRRQPDDRRRPALAAPLSRDGADRPARVAASAGRDIAFEGRYNARPRGYSSAGRAPGSHPGGRRFEPA